MNLITITLVIVAVGGSAAGKLSTKYLPPNYGGHHQQQAAAQPNRHYQGVHGGTSGSVSGHHYGSQYHSHSSPHSTAQQQTPIVRNNYANDGNGNYNFDFETGNGIQRNEVGSFSGGWPHGSQSVSGSYSYTGDDGHVYTVNYKADDKGFHAEGAHLPTPPPVPREIQQSLGHHHSGSAKSGGLSGYYGAGSASHGGHHQHYSGAASAPTTQYLPPQQHSQSSAGYTYGQRHY